jgi:Putative transposase of IS4/5 family (DUF4096)
MRRAHFNGVIWRFRTGSAWRDVPERYGPWPTVAGRFRVWASQGVFQHLLDGLIAEAAARGQVQVSDLDVESEFFAEFPAQCVGGRLVGLGHAAGQVPVGLVGGIDEEDAAGRVADDGVGADALVGLLGVALGQVGVPRLRAALVQFAVRVVAGLRE